MDERAIVVGTDGSETAERAVERAGKLARALDVPLHIVCSCARPAGAWMAAAGGIAIDCDEPSAIEEAGEVLDQACRRLSQQGVEARSHVCRGDAAEALVAIANAERAQMIVVGNRGMSGARRVLGSVPNRVSHRARCAVLIVPTS
jgi:nucleotide-binding universal stress UspA family protein